MAAVTSPPSRASEPASWVRTLLIATTTAAFTACAALLMFSAFMYYDDEGYVLISYRHFAEHGQLYREVYSQYGPFPYVATWLFHELGLPLTHTVGRLGNLFAWVGCALCAAHIVWRGTRSLAAAVVGLGITFPYLWIMTSEPSHPGGMTALGTALIAAAGHSLLLEGRGRAWSIVVGSIGAALTLTKINVGAFVVFSSLAWLLLHHESPTVRRRARLVVGTGAVLLAVGLMRPMLHVGWVRSLVIAFGGAAIALALSVSATGPSPRGSWRLLRTGLLAGTVVAAAVFAVIFLRDTTPADLLEGIILGPIQHPGAYNLRYTWASGSDLLMAGSVVLCALACWLRRRGAALVDPAVAALRILASIGALYAAWQYPDSSPDRLVFGYAAPCLWLFAWRLDGEDADRHAAMGWVAAVWLGQFLHPFPVAGSQIAWGTFLALPLALVGAARSLAWLAERRPGFPLHRPGMAVVLRGVLLLYLAGVGWRFSQAAARYWEGSDLNLPGAEPLRLPTEATALFRLLTLNASVHGDVLFTEPGMASLNLWSGMPTPTLAHATHWFSLLRPDQQTKILETLKTKPRACIVIQRDHLRYLIQHSFAPAGALHEYIAQNFSPAFTLDDFEFCVRNGRTIEPLHLGEMIVYSEARDETNTALRIRLLLPPNQAVTRIRLTAPQVPGAEPIVFSAANARLEIVARAVDGAMTGRPANWPLHLEGVATVLVHFDRFKGPRPIAGGLITLEDASGAEVALARLKR